VTIGLLVTAIAFVALDRFIPGIRTAGTNPEVESVNTTTPVTAAPPEVLIPAKSIAVLPFVNMSSDEEQEYFSDGLSEELLNLLAKIPELRVIARTSSFAYKGTNTKIVDIARELNVTHVLEGSVRKAGDQLRITAQLIRANDSSHMWSETYDRTVNNIFAIQDEIASAVVDQLKVTLLGNTPTIQQTDLEAYALYLQARQLFLQGTVESYEQSIALFRQALVIDPEYAAAWDGLAANYIRQSAVGLKYVDEGYALGREAVNKALAIEPDYAPAHATLGRIAINFDGELAAGARHFERALTLDPGNTSFLQDAATLYRALGHLDRALTLSEYIVTVDPVNSIAYSRLGLINRYSGNLDAAIAAHQTALRLSPGRITSHYAISQSLLFKGEPEAALLAIQQEHSSWRLIGIPMVYHALGKAAESDAALVNLIENHEQSAAYNIAYVLAFRGEVDRAFEWLDKAVQYNDTGLADIAVTPEFSNIRDDPRWLTLLESLGQSPTQLDAIEFEVKLPE